MPPDEVDILASIYSNNSITLPAVYVLVKDYVFILPSSVKLISNTLIKVFVVVNYVLVPIQSGNPVLLALISLIASTRLVLLSVVN